MYNKNNVTSSSQYSKDAIHLWLVRDINLKQK